MESVKKKNKYEIDMLNGSIMDKLISFALPLALSGILQLLFNAVDLIVVGRFGPEGSLAAVGATTSLINMTTNLFIGMSVGVSVLAARFHATGRDKEMSETVHTAITLGIVAGVIMLLVGQIFSRWALTLMGTPENVLDMAVQYMQIYFLGMIFFMVYNYGAAVLRAVGDTKRPLIFLVISGLSNAALNLFFVIVMNMGVAGVAIGTVISQGIACTLVLICLHRADASYRLRFSKLTIKKEHLKKILQVGVPAGLQGTIIDFSNVLLQSSVNSFGDVAMSGYTAANNLFGFTYVATNAVTQACMNFTSQNYAAGKFERLKKVFGNCALLSFIVCAVMGSAIFFFSEQILKIYTSGDDVIACGVQVLTYSTLTYFLCGWMDLVPGALRGLGHATAPMILSLVGTVGFRLLWIYGIFPANRELSFLFISYPGSWATTLIMQIICFYIVWKKIYKAGQATDSI